MEKRRIEMPPEVKRILRTLEEGGFEAYVVGGCVRDSLLGREPSDWDITTSALPMEVKALFPRTIDTGLKHGTVTIPSSGKNYEVTTYRIDGAYLDGRHPSGVTFTRSLREDLQRRDFTINAMACSDREGLQDYFDGMGDLERGIVRAVGEPDRRFGEDSLRIMRAVRFAAQLGFRIEERTLDAMKRLAPTLRRISAERIAAELEKLLLSPHPGHLRLAWECGITAQVLPEFDLCMETPQNNPHHLYSVGEHTVRSVMNARPDRTLRLALLLHDFGKPACRTTDAAGVDHFHGHPEAGAVLAGRILRRLKYDNRTIRDVVRLVRFHDRKIRLTAPGVRRGIREIGEDLFPLLLEVKEADLFAQSAYLRRQKLDELEKLRSLYGKIVEDGDCLSLKDLAVTGADLIAAGVPEGRLVGEILEALLADVLDDPSRNRRDHLLERVHCMMQDAGNC